jgi:hypothetical protein
MELSEAIKQIVRGEVKWDILQKMGLQISLIEDIERKWTFPPIEFDPVPVHIEDLATGFVNMEGKDDASQWASFLLASSLIDIELLEKYPKGLDLIEGLWDLAFGESLSDETVAAVREIVREKANEL